MKRRLAAMILLAGLSMLGAQAAGPVTLTWYGQACFLLHSPGGTDVLMDPFNDQVGYPVPAVRADAVTVSHEHFDHNNVAAAQGNPIILRGLTNDGWAKIDRTVGDVRIRSVSGAFHDNQGGAQRGRDAIMVFQTGGLTIAHLGDLGQLLTPQLIQAIGKVDVLLLPVGGVYTIDAGQATQVMAQLNPKIVIPMHYKTPRNKVPLNTVDAFLQGKPRVERINGPTLELKTLPAQTTIMVLTPK